MQCGTRNAPADIQGNINSTIPEGLDDVTSTLFDEVLRYSLSEEEHIEQLMWVVQCLLEDGFYLNLEKCKFHKQTVK